MRCAAAVAVWGVLAVVAAFAQQPPRDEDLATGIQFVDRGDFAAAEEVLRAVTAKLEGTPGRLRELAEAYLYLGIARLEQDRLADARADFREAQRRNRALVLPATEFSAQVIREFALAASEAPAVATNGDAVPSAPRAPPVDTWITRTASGVDLRLALGTSSRRCDGTLRLDRDARILSWISTGNGECASFQAPFRDVRLAARAHEGGLSLTFAPGVRGRTTFMPAPSAEYFDGGTEGLLASDLPPEVDEQVRQAIAPINLALEGGANLSVTRVQYGIPVDVSLADLINAPGDYDGRAVRTRGRFEVISRDRGQYALYANTLTVLAVPDPDQGAARLVQAQARDLRAVEVEITGAFRRRVFDRSPAKGVPEYEIFFWRVDGPETLEPGAAENGRRLALEELNVADDPPAGVVTVVGKFRGGNLFADLPRNSRRRNGDWVIRDDIFSAWVTGKAPEGDGWKLDIRSQADSVNWVAVTGVVRKQDGFVYLEAQTVEVSRPPSPTAAVVNAPIVSAKRTPGEPAEIMFSYPVPGVEDVARDSIFAVQFSKEMDGRSFEGRVRFGYVGADAPFAGQAAAYDPVRRALTIDPGEALEDGRDLELLLLPGIRDLEGVAIPPAPDAEPRGAVRVLRWRVGGPR